jgi:RNA polymerase sigma factor (sigma-70 family)
MQGLIEQPSVDVTITATMKHTALLKAVRKLGSQQALAEYLGTGQRTISRWLSLRGCPPREANKHWPAEKLIELELRLIEATGQTMEELFPDSLRLNQDFLNAPKKTEKVMELESHMMACIADSTTRRLTQSSDPEQALADEEQREEIESAMKSLPSREQDVVRRRFLDGRETYKEIGESLGISPERVRQVESKALSRLRMMSRGSLQALAKEVGYKETDWESERMLED